MDTRFCNKEYTTKNLEYELQDHSKFLVNYCYKLDQNGHTVKFFGYGFGMILKKSMPEIYFDVNIMVYIMVIIKIIKVSFV